MEKRSVALERAERAAVELVGEAHVGVELGVSMLTQPRRLRRSSLGTNGVASREFSLALRLLGLDLLFQRL